MSPGPSGAYKLTWVLSLYLNCLSRSGTDCLSSILSSLIIHLFSVCSAFSLCKNEYYSFLSSLYLGSKTRNQHYSWWVLKLLQFWTLENLSGGLPFYLDLLLLLFNIFLLPDVTRCSRLILYFHCPCIKTVISPRNPGSFYWRMIFGNQNMVTGCALLLLQS